MQKTFDEIRTQIHEIRNILGPFDTKLAGLDHRIAEMRLLIDERLGAFESKLFGATFKVEEHSAKIEDLWDRMNWIEATLKVPPRPTRKGLQKPGA